MKKSLLEFYALAICFVTVVCLIIALGIETYGVIGMTNPEFTLSPWAYTQHQTNDGFWSPQSAAQVQSSACVQVKERPDETELTKLRLVSFEVALSNERRENAQSAAKSAIVILIDLIMFFLHWQIARRARQNAA